MGSNFRVTFIPKIFFVNIKQDVNIRKNMHSIVLRESFKEIYSCVYFIYVQRKVSHCGNSFIIGGHSFLNFLIFRLQNKMLFNNNKS